jgi:exonuclease VII small subunit
MIVPVRPVILGVTLAVLVFTAPSKAAAPPETPTPPASSPQGQTSKQPNSDYGSGGNAVMQNDTSGAELHGTVYDSSGTLRHDETNTYTAPGGAEHKTEQHAYDFDFKGHLQLGLDYKYDLRGGLSYSDITHYGLHGERIAEEVTNYRADGFEIKDWSLGTHQWYTNFTPYKTPLPTGTAAQAPLTPTNTNIGVLFPRSYAAGETITGSLWPSTYAENFKVVPGLSEYSFPIQLYHLPDGLPEWSSLQIGVKGDGYFPVNPNGTFSVHIPYDWKGPLQLQARQPNPVAGLGPTSAFLYIDPPIAALALTNGQFPTIGLSRFHEDIKDHLVDLWEDACDLEETLDDLYSETTPDWATIYAVKDDLKDIYAEIDEVEDDMSPEEVISLAHEMQQESIDFYSWLSKRPNLTADDKDDLDDAESWADFLDDEIGYARFMAGWGPAHPIVQPYFTNPVLMQGKLGVIGGSFSLDPYDTHIHIDKFSITPLAATPNSWYFMPPSGLTAGQHDYLIDGPLFSETIFPFFYMTLTMSADQLNLHKGQHTTYHLILDGLNGLPGGAWGGSSDPTDLIGSSELSAAQKAAGPSRKGYITLTVTNESPGVISMQNQFKTLDASFFAPSGSFKLDGGVGAIRDGGFSISGVARAYLQPEIGVGIPPGTTLSGGSTDFKPGILNTNWLPPFSLNYDPVAFKNSSFMTYCPGYGAAPASTPCVESVIDDLYPPKPKVESVVDDLKSTPPVKQVQDNSTDSKKLQDAEKRVQEAKEKEKAAFTKLLSAGNVLESTFKDGLDKADPELQEKLKQAEDRLKKATEEREKAAATQEATPTAENEKLLRYAQVEETEAWSAADAARKEVIYGFDADTKKAYDQAVDDYNKASKEWLPTENEKRAAYEALEKLENTQEEVRIEIGI